MKKYLTRGRIRKEQEVIKEHECPICFNNIDILKNRVLLSCGHNFHMTCIANWCRTQGNNKITCPCCRDVIIPAKRDSIDMNTIYMAINTLETTRIRALERQIRYLKSQRYIILLPSMLSLLMCWTWNSISDDPDDFIIQVSSGFGLIILGYVIN